MGWTVSVLFSARCCNVGRDGGFTYGACGQLAEILRSGYAEEGQAGDGGGPHVVGCEMVLEGGLWSDRLVTAIAQETAMG